MKQPNAGEEIPARVNFEALGQHLDALILLSEI
jgi:hypothetical protein